MLRRVSPQPVLPAWAACLVSAVAGAIATSTTTWWSTIGAVAILTALIDGRTMRGGALIGFVFGIGWFGVSLAWVDVVGVDALVLLVLFCSGYFAVMAALQTVVLRFRGGAWWAACLWVGQEAIRDRAPLGGFPWSRLATNVADPTVLTGPLQLGGYALSTFALAAFGTWLAVAVRALLTNEPGVASWRRILPIGTVVVVGGAVISLLPVLASAASDVTPTQTLDVAVIQGSVPGQGLDFLGRRRAVLDNHLEQTRLLAEDIAAGTETTPDLVIWPENASDIDLLADASAASDVENAAALVGAPILVGTVIAVPEDPTLVRNAAVLVRPGGAPEVVYVKQHPVPFGEYIPFREQLQPFIGRLDRIPRDFVGGDSPGAFDLDGRRLGVAICFEVAYDELLRESVREGAELLIVMTNNATYAATDQPEQQFTKSRARAIEHERTTAIAATTGITAVVTPTGAILEQLPERVPGRIVKPVQLAQGSTLATRLGAVPELVLAIVGGVALLAASALHRTRGRQHQASRPLTAPQDRDET